MKANRWIGLAMVAAALWLLFGGSVPTWIPGGAPAPISDPGLRVLITFDAESKASLPRPQLATIDSNSLRAYLDAHCAKDAGGTPEWRIVPHVTTFSADEPIWQKLMALPRKSEPWLTAGNGRTGFSGPLPADEAATLAIITPLEK